MGDSTQSGGRSSTENGYQLKALSGGVKPLVILLCPERWRPGQRRAGAVADQS